MSRTRNANIIRSSKDDRIAYLEKQRRLLQIREQIDALAKQAEEVNRSLIDQLNAHAKRDRIDPRSYTFDWGTLEFTRSHKSASPGMKRI